MEQRTPFLPKTGDEVGNSTFTIMRKIRKPLFPAIKHVYFFSNSLIS